MPDLPLWANIVILAGFIYSIILHEIAHGYAAYLLGDRTASLQGRLSLNPIVHIDPIMTLILPLSLYIGSGGRFAFGGAKPVPVNILAFRNQNKGMMLTAIAGPMVNIVLALIFGFSSKLIITLTISGTITSDPKLLLNIFFYLGLLNIILAAFNMVPIPPLDGSRLLRYFLPRNIQVEFDKLERFGMLIVIFVVMSGALSPIFERLFLLYTHFIYGALI